MNSAASRPALMVALGTVTFSLMLATASPAEAATSLKQRALNVAKTKKGSAYQYGAAGPNRFDCSGLVMYSYGKVGKKLKHNAQAQYNASRHVSPGSRKPGDLVFIGRSSKGIYHVGIYAGFWSGKGWMWDSPKPGRKVGAHPIKDYTAGKPMAIYGEFK